MNLLLNSGVLGLALLLLLPLHLFTTILIHADSSQPSSVSIGTTFTPDQNNKILVSPNDNLFSLGFRKWNDKGLDYCMCGVLYEKKDANAAIWSFNIKPSPVQGSACKLVLAENGELSFYSDNEHVVWTSNTAGLGVQNMTLREDGNLVLTNAAQLIIWQSFTAFNDIFLFPSGMNFTRNTTLYERISVPQSTQFNIPGNYALVLSPQGDLLMVLLENMYAYHSFNPYNASQSTINAALVDHVMVGNAIEYYDASSNLMATVPSNTNQSPNTSFPIRSGYVQGGNFLINYWNGSKNIGYYNSTIEPCYMPKACEGQYRLCTTNGPNLTCKCPPGFISNSSNDCNPINYKYNMKPINVVFHPQFSPHAVASQTECLQLCSANSSCNAALFDSSTSSCSLFPILYTIPEGGPNNSSQLMFLKIPKSKNRSTAIIAGAVVGTVSFLIIGLLILFILRRRRRLRSDEFAVKIFLQNLPRLPPQFTYRDLQLATGDFSKKLGSGGFGSVYEGELGSTKVKIAVKKLDQGGAGEIAHSTQQFQAEVATIGSVSHVNLVRLRGFCVEGDYRLLVYEFMAGGSLDRWLFRKEKDGESNFVLDWETRYKIALHTARGLEYLHHQCGPEHIVHCDVKPENILLDEDFNAKVADFGLAKLIDGNEMQGFMMTTLKGTRGYLAPEWLQETSITSKSDVYSYGVVLLELITGRRCLDSVKGYLPTWVLSVVKSSSSSSPMSAPSSSLVLSNPTGSISFNSFDYDAEKVVDNVLDKQLVRTSVSTESFKRLFTLALGCVQSEPNSRPSMASVVQILEEDQVEKWNPNWPIDSAESTPSASPLVMQSLALLHSTVRPREDSMSHSQVYLSSRLQRPDPR